MKQRVCKCCGKKMRPVPAGKSAEEHVCQECAVEEAAKPSTEEEKDKEKKIIRLDRFR